MGELAKIFIFVIVYFLFLDIRSLGECPPPMEDLRLPVADENDEYDDDDEEEKLRKIVATVPNCGRGVLAKVGLLTHASYESYQRNVMPHRRQGVYHVDVIQNLFDEREKTLSPQHPFAYSVALAQISSLLHAMVVNDDPTFYDSFLNKIFLPWAGRTSGPDKSTYFYLRLATKNITSEHNFDDLPPFSTREVQEVVGECIDAYFAEDILYDNGYGDKDGSGVKRFRLNGNYSKEEILHASIVSKTATFVDLEHCWNLDEECLGLALHHLKDVKVMLLKGTPITETSEVIKTANMGRKQRIKFVFSDACKCCGERNGRIKELQLSRPRKVQRTS